MLGVRAFGVPVSPKDSRAMIHLWRYVGWHVAHRLFRDTGLERLRRRGHARQRRLIASYFGKHPARIIHPTPDHPAHLG